MSTRYCNNEEAIGAINEAPIGSTIPPRNPPSFFVSIFAVSVALSTNGPELLTDFAILIISSTSSFEMKKYKP